MNGQALVSPKTGRILSQMKQPTLQYAKRHVVQIKRSAAEQGAVSSLNKRVSRMVRKRNTIEALETFRASSVRAVMDKVEHDRLQSKIAAGFLYKGDFVQALTLASQSAKRSGNSVPHSAWVAGLALWQMDQADLAAPYFETVANSEYADGWLASAGGFWAARSYDRVGNKALYNAMLVKSAQHSHTFYGLMAAKALGQNGGFNWEKPEYVQAHGTLILSHESGRRAHDLIAAEQYDLAESEFLRMKYKGNNSLRRAVLAYTSHVGLPGLAMRLGNMVKAEGGEYYDSAAYPLSPWEPEGGYKIDPAFVHAVIRQESRFNLQAVSHVGASGLMQIMPKTAQYIADKKGYVGFSTQALHIPEKNLKIGQDYISYLMNGPYVDGDVVSLLVAYNAGPGNLLKWRKRVKGSEDPLLFVEMLPVHETREYVERVLSNYWIYRNRAGLETPSLAALSKVKPPKYATSVMDGDNAHKFASRH